MEPTTLEREPRPVPDEDLSAQTGERETSGFEGDDLSTTELEMPRTGPGRFRRWVLRPLFWGAAFVAILVFVFQLFLDTRRARDLGRNLLVEWLSQRFDREISIGDLELDLVPLSLQVWDFKIGGLTPEDPPLLELPWGEVDASLLALQNRVIRLRQIRAERPILRFQFLPDGTSNVISFRSKSGRPRRFDVYIDRLEVEKARVFLEQDSIELSLAADLVRARLEGVGEMHLDGQVAVQEVEVRLRGARPQKLGITARLGFERTRFDLHEAHVTHPLLDATGSGSCEWSRERQEDRKCLFLVRGQTHGEMLASLGWFNDLTGKLAFDGSLGWRPGATGWRSRIEAPALRVWERDLREVAGTLGADRYGLRFNLERAGYAGGTLTGVIEHQARTAEQPIAVDLDFEGLDLDTVLADQKIPARGLGARLAGRVGYRFPRKQPRRGDGVGEIALTPDPERGLPLGGTVPVVIDTGRIITTAVSAQSATQSILGRGWYDLERQRGLYDYQIASADLEELSHLLPFDAQFRAESRWLPKAGEGELEGTLYLEPGETSADVRFRLANVVTATLETATATGSTRVTREALEAFQLSLGDPDQALLLGGRIPYALETDPQGLDLVVHSAGWPTERIRPWVPFELPFEGKLSGRLDLHVDAHGHRGKLRATAAPATVQGVPLESITGWIDWNDQILQISHLVLAGPAGRLTGGGTVDWASDEVELHLDGSALELSKEPLARFLPRRDLHGTAAATVQVSGRVEQPRVEVEIQVPRLALGEEALGAGTSRLALTWDGRRLHAQGRLLDAIRFQGGGALDRERADLTFTLAADNVQSLLGLALEQPPADVAGSLSGRVRISGAYGGEVSPEVDLELAHLQLDYRDRRLTNLEPVGVRLMADRAVVRSLFLGEEATGSELFFTGTVGYEASKPLDLRLQSTLSASWLKLFLPELEIEGSFDLLGKLGGTLEHPTFDGQGELHPTRAMLPAAFPHSLEELSGRVLFYPDLVVLDHLRAKLAGGTLEATGAIALPEGEAAPGYRLQVTGRDLRVRYPEGWVVHGDTQLTITSTEEGFQVGGRAELDEVVYREDVPVGFEQIFEGFFHRQRLEVGDTASLLSKILLNVEISAPGALRVDNNLAQLQGGAELSLRGSLARPVIFGTLDVEPGGLLTYGSTEYTLERGRLAFTDPYSIAPEVDLVATTRVREFDITLTLTGSLEKLQAGFASEPPLPAHEVFQVLASGGDEAVGSSIARRSDELGGEQSTSAATFLYGQAASVVGNRVSNLFGLDKFRIDPLTGSGDNVSTARVTVGKRISKDLFLTYSIDPASTEEQRLQVEWQVRPGFLIVLTQNGDNTYSADARWQRSF